MKKKSSYNVAVIGAGAIVLEGKEKPFVKPEESLAVQKILDAIYLSAAIGREVKLR